jgi:hypothetical protein
MTKRNNYWEVGGGMKGISERKDQEKTQNEEDEEDLKTLYKNLASSDQKMTGIEKDCNGSQGPNCSA